MYSGTCALVGLLYFRHFNTCVVVSQCGFILHFPNDLFATLCFLSRNICSHLLTIFIGFVFYYGILTVWDRSPLSDMWYTNIFSRSIICLFTVLTVSFKELKFLNFDVVQFIKMFKSHVFGVASKKYLSNQRSQILCVFFYKFCGFMFYV